MPRSRRGIGADAEDLAAQFLLESGLTLVTRRYHCRGGEIDIVCLDGETVVFVEVKARRSALPEEAFRERKSSRMRVAARHFLAGHATPESPHRFDLVAIEGDTIRHHRAVELSES